MWPLEEEPQPPVLPEELKEKPGKRHYGAKYCSFISLILTLFIGLQTLSFPGELPMMEAPTRVFNQTFIIVNCVWLGVQIILIVLRRLTHVNDVIWTVIEGVGALFSCYMLIQWWWAWRIACGRHVGRDRIIGNWAIIGSYLLLIIALFLVLCVCVLWGNANTIAANRYEKLNAEYHKQYEEYAERKKTYTQHKDFNERTEREYQHELQAYNQSVQDAERENQQIIARNQEIITSSISRRDDENKRIRNDLATRLQALAKAGGSWYPPDYYSLEAVDMFRKMLRNHQVDSVKEMVQLFMEHDDRRRILDATQRINDQLIQFGESMNTVIRNQETLAANQQAMISQLDELGESLQDISENQERVITEQQHYATILKEGAASLDRMEAILDHVDSVATANMVVNAITAMEMRNVSDVASVYAARTNLR